MTKRHIAWWITCLTCLLAGCASDTLPDSSPAPTPRTTDIAHHGMVATVHPIATQAGIDAMKRGGNAIDAAVAAALVLGVVDGHNSGLGGGCFILMRRANGSLLAIDGRETAPAKAHRDMYLRHGKMDPNLSTTGALASGVPGALAAYDHALQNGGKLTLKNLLLPAADQAEKGFALDANYAARLKSTASELAQFKASAAILLNDQGQPWPEGHILKQPDLARTYRHIADHGIDWFYKGPFSERIESWMKANGGILTATDFAAYHAKPREPVLSTYRDHTIVGFGPPSSGGVHVAQILNILERFDLTRLEQRDPAQRLHVMAQAMKLAFADRAYWLGDPDYTTVPRGLVSKTYAHTLAARIDVNQTTTVTGHDTPPDHDKNLFGKHTTHIAAADAQGNWVAITTTLNTPFGSKVTIPGTGVVLNNQMDDFSAQPGVPNTFGLIGAEANCIASGKRPLSSMSPTVVLAPDGQPVMTLGAAGGPTIISQVVQVIVNHIDLAMPLPQAVVAARIHHQWRPDTLFVEPSLAPDTIDRIKQIGHAVQERRLGVCQAIGWTEHQQLVGVSDPRVGGSAIGLNIGQDK